MKYVVYRDGDKELLVTFPRCIDHDKMAECMECMRFGGRNWHRNQGEIVAAGFVEGRQCSGKSETLGIQSRPTIDTQILMSGGVRSIATESGTTP